MIFDDIPTDFLDRHYPSDERGCRRRRHHHHRSPASQQNRLATVDAGAAEVGVGDVAAVANSAVSYLIPFLFY